jgi:hypothetical protein
MRTVHAVHYQQVLHAAALLPGMALATAYSDIESWELCSICMLSLTYEACYGHSLACSPSYSLGNFTMRLCTKHDQKPSPKPALINHPALLRHPCIYSNDASNPGKCTHMHKLVHTHIHVHIYTRHTLTHTYTNTHRQPTDVCLSSIAEASESDEDDTQDKPHSRHGSPAHADASTRASDDTYTGIGTYSFPSSLSPIQQIAGKKAAAAAAAAAAQALASDPSTPAQQHACAPTLMPPHAHAHTRTDINNHPSAQPNSPAHAYQPHQHSMPPSPDVHIHIHPLLSAQSLPHSPTHPQTHSQPPSQQPSPYAQSQQQQQHSQPHTQSSLPPRPSHRAASPVASPTKHSPAVHSLPLPPTATGVCECVCV